MDLPVSCREPPRRGTRYEARGPKKRIRTDRPAREEIMDEAQRTYLLLNQVGILYRQSASTFLFPVFAALALCLFLWDISDHDRLLAWTGTVIIYTLLRFIIIGRQHRAAITPESAVKWLDMFTAGALLSGILWGLAAIILVPYQPDGLVSFTLYNGLTLLIVCGLAAGALISYSVSKTVLLFYAVPALAPPAFYLIWLGDMFNTALGGYVLLYLIFITVSSFRLNREFLRFLNMEYELRRLELEYRELEKKSRSHRKR